MNQPLPEDLDRAIADIVCNHWPSTEANVLLSKPRLGALRDAWLKARGGDQRASKYFAKE